MNKKEYFLYHQQACQKMSTITQAKNADYTGTAESPFANFIRVESMGITDTMRGMLVRMTDKMARLTSFVQKGHLEVKDESFEDTCLDLANYAILLAAYSKHKKNLNPNGGGGNKLVVAQAVTQGNVLTYIPPNLKGDK